MKKFYFRGIYLSLILSLFCIPSLMAQQTLIKVSDWNAYVHLPWDYNANPGKSYPTIIFIPGLGEIGTNPARLLWNGPGAYLGQGWNGNVKVGTDSIKFIIISLQPPSAWPRPWTIKTRIDQLRSMYRIKDMHFTGLSMGGWASYWYSYYYPDEVTRVVGVESVVPLEDQDFIATYKPYANANGQLLAFEQSWDYRKNDSVVWAMNLVNPGSAEYIGTDFGGGGHCCWSEFYGGGGKLPTVFNIDGKSANLYEWIAAEYAMQGPLPVTIADITALGREHSVDLYWSTSSEVNSKTFEIQRSINGTDFEIIGQVQASGDSKVERKYTFTDETPSKGSNFYRLKMIDRDGSSAYSKTVSAKVAYQSALLVKNVSLAPGGTGLRMLIESNETTHGNLSVFDASGRVYLNAPLTIREGANSIQEELKLNGSGIFYLRLTTDKENYTQSLFSK